MLPVIFGKIDTYYVLWSAALALMYLWTERRAVRLYGMTRDDASSVLWWVFLGAFTGSALGGYADNWERYYQDPVKILRFWESAASSGPGFIGGGLLGMWKLKRLGAPVNKFADATAIPCAFMMTIGRIGCFANGCCAGLPTDSPFGLRFPGRPTPIWPSQAFESAAALIIGALLIAIERYRVRHGLSLERAVLFPAFLITYGCYRIAFDFLREGRNVFGLQTGQYAGIIAAVTGVCWLFCAALIRGKARERS